ncbi:MAG: phosphomannomutase [Chromatiales bacterium]|nr:phosphomannomutase [Chromatiales bacterium]
MQAPFKAYDIRGRLPDEINEELAYSVGHAFAAVMRPAGEVAIGRDVRETSPALAAAVARGLNDAGIDTVDVGLCGTETVYYAAGQPGRGGGIMVTASHNPIDYNGMKLVREEARPISADSGLAEIAAAVAAGTRVRANSPGRDRTEDVTDAYVDQLLRFVDLAKLTPLHLVADAGNGAAGPTFDALAARLPFRVTRIRHEPDPTFPNGIPNPLLPENQRATSEAVVAAGADIGIAWDGDFDRCFVFDAEGRFVDGYYLVGLLASQLLAEHPGARIVHDPRLYWYTREAVTAAGGTAIRSKTGHAFIKERMRAEDAVYGGEISGHHYFRDFFYCDSGMIPWLLVTARMCTSGASLAELVAEAQAAYPCSGEINRRVADPDAIIAAIDGRYSGDALETDYTDGLDISFADWRFSLRKSNTEPLLRLNVEARGDRALMQQRTAELLALIDDGA